MKASALKQNRTALDLAGHQFSTVSRDPGDRKAGDLGICESPRLVDRRRQPAKTCAQAHRNLRVHPFQPLAYGLHRLGQLGHWISANSRFTEATRVAFSSSGRKALSKLLRMSRSISARVKPS